MAIQSLFGPSVADIEELRRRQAEESIAGAGREFGVFAPLYRSGMRFGMQGAQAVNTLFGAEDPMLKKARDVQNILGRYQGQDLTSPEVLGSISKDLAGFGYANEAMALAQNARTAMREQQRADLEQQRFDLETKRFLDTQARGQRELELRDRQVMLEEVNKDPYGSIQRALAMPEDSPLRQTILAGASARIGEKNVDQHIKTLEAQRLVAQTKQAEAAVTGGQAVTQFLTTDGKGLVFKNGKYYRTDTGAEYKDKLVPNRAMTQAEALVALGASQGGAVTPAQARAAGLSDDEVRRLLRGGGGTGSSGGGSTWNME